VIVSFRKIQKNYPYFFRWKLLQMEKSLDRKIDIAHPEAVVAARPAPLDAAALKV